ncbi:MAG TPA: (2Fe-2S)-binding protein [Aquabacterium sp.]|nr:(2Fe-2S)-binding protein [Aquabacterium sp.]
MIVCVCHRVSDREIARHAQQGCASFEDLQIDTGVATCCGCCESCAREVFHEARPQGTQRIDISRLVAA